MFFSRAIEISDSNAFKARVFYKPTTKKTLILENN